MDASNLIKDFGLSVPELRAKWEDRGGHWVIPKEHWREAVNQDDTDLGYWEWVHHQIAEYQDDLDRSNPYNN